MLMHMLRGGNAKLVYHRCLLLQLSNLVYSNSNRITNLTEKKKKKKIKKINEPERDKIYKIICAPAKTQTSLLSRAVWSESSFCAQRVAKDPELLHAYGEDSDQTMRVRRLICVSSEHTCHFIGFFVLQLKYPLHIYLFSGPLRRAGGTKSYKF